MWNRYGQEPKGPVRLSVEGRDALGSEKEKEGIHTGHLSYGAHTGRKKPYNLWL